MFKVKGKKLNSKPLQIGYKVLQNKQKNLKTIHYTKESTHMI